jgi:uncharacterized protein (TIGR02231 family)
MSKAERFFSPNSLTLAFFGVVGLVLSTGSRADDLDVASSIDRVTVFLSGAEVTRTGTATIPAGEHRLIIQNLPAGIDPARLQLNIGNENVRLGTLQLDESHEGELVSEEERRLQAELDQLLFERQEIADRIEAANTQLRLLASLADGSVGGQQTSLDIGELSALLQTLSASSIDAREVIREANRELALKEQEIEQKRFELSQVATRRRTEQVLTVAVTAESAVTTEVAVTYPVNQARWSWLYEARLDTESRSLNLERKVSVSQGSGEDWSEVEVTITTARPNQNTRTPQLGSLLVDFYRPQPPIIMESRARSAVDLEEAAVTGGFLSSSEDFAASAPGVQVQATQYLVNFEIPGRVSVSADRQPQILPIDQRQGDVVLVTRAVPEVDTNAYLEARFTLDSDQPLQAGVMQFYRDGAFIGRRPVPSFQPQEEISLPFGQDERVRVEVFPEQEESRDGGTFRRTAVDDRRVRYQVTSFHASAIDLEVLARIAVPQNEDIEVEIDARATPFDQQDIDGNRGVLLWQLQAQPAEPVEIRHYYSIRYPEDERLEFRGR